MLTKSAGALLAIAALTPASAVAADTEGYPAKPLRLIIAYAAGGGTDVVGSPGIRLDRPAA